MVLTKQEKIRYHRQLIMPEIDVSGQEKLKQARVLLVGLGGLGSISANYLVAAGIGHLRIVDGDRVSLDNLNRQILHWTDDIGHPKAVSAADKLRRLNPACRIEAFAEMVADNNLRKLVGDSQIIIDATDNLATRKLLNRASVENKIPLVYGGVEGFKGMVSVFVPGQSACLECLFPFSPAARGPLGVIGPVPGLIASIQVIETVKLILSLAGSLTSTLLCLDTADMSFKSIKVDKNPDCAVCGTGGGFGDA